MSEEIKGMAEEEEFMKMLSEFANACYGKGAKDVLIGVGVGAAFLTLVVFGSEAIETWKDRRKTKKLIKEFVKDETERES